jgi:aerobic-type carbon monoxide dehydrogenase small subunit (CoxS/CutS family)
MQRRVEVTINDRAYSADVEARMLLSDFIRHVAGLTGTHVGCEHGVCGACTVQLDGVPVRSCLMFAVQANGTRIRTVEGMTQELEPEEPLSVLQQAFHECHALQCGFCTPGFLMSAEPLLLADGEMSDTELREALAGNLCRCTGYESIVAAVRLARARTPRLPQFLSGEFGPLGE